MAIYARDAGVWKNVSGGDITSPAIVSGGTVSTYTDSGITYQVNTFTSDGTLNVSSAGVADILIVVGGGGSGANGSVEAVVAVECHLGNLVIVICEANHSTYPLVLVELVVQAMVELICWSSATGG